VKIERNECDSMSKKITSWKQFAREVREKDGKLLARASKMDSLIFVSGCQRSGTTILSKVLMQSSEVASNKTGLDSELEGALILCGHLPLSSDDKRYCFQTTYLNERYGEYFEHLGKFKLVFVVRNPYSVVYSMMYHWKRRRKLRNFALDELFRACGKFGLSHSELKRLELFGPVCFSTLKKSCLSYVYKMRQVFDIGKKLGNDLMVVEYDDIIQEKNRMLKRVFVFLGLQFEPKYGQIIHSDSLSKADRLSKRQKMTIRQICWQTYDEVRAIAVAANQDEGGDSPSLSQQTGFF